MPLQTISYLSLEVLIVMIGAASLATGNQAGGSPDDLVWAWCLFGGCLGSVCSLHFFRVPPSPHANADIAWQFGVNLILSAVFSPLLVPWVAAWVHMPEHSMRVAVPTATAVGIVAQRIVARVLPRLQRILDAKAAKLEADHAAQRETRDGSFLSE